MSDLNKETEELILKITPLLAGKGPKVQGAALAQLVAMWLAGHQDPSYTDTPDIKELRNGLMELFTETVMAFVPIESQEIQERHLSTH